MHAADLPEGVQSVVRSDGLLLQESQVAVGYDYWPAATVLKVGVGDLFCVSTQLFHGVMCVVNMHGFSA